MHVDNYVSFEEVCASFRRDNPIGFGSSEWALTALEIADKQFGTWLRRDLSLEDILGVMLPHHLHDGQEVVPKVCSTVSEAIERLKSIPHSHSCSKRIDEVSRRPLSPVFLSAAPIHHPDYQGLTDRDYRGLTHLDGFHRLIAWGRSGQSEIVAYIAGALALNGQSL
jgi:hypothetical protein